MSGGRTTRIAFGVLFMLRSGAWAAAAPEIRPPDDGETVGMYKKFLRDSVDERLRQEKARLGSGSAAEVAGGEASDIGAIEQQLLPSQKSSLVKEVEGTVAAKTTSASPPEGFADRVSNGFADFLPLFQGAINAVSTSEDKKSLTIKFNALRSGHGDVALSAVVTEPEVFKPLQDAIVEPARENQNKVLLGRTGDFSDVTFPLTYGFRRESGSWDNSKMPILWGRETATYRLLVDRLLELAWEGVSASTGAALDTAKTDLGSLEIDMKTHFEQNPSEGISVKPFFAVDDLTFAAVKKALPAKWQDYVAALQRDARAKVALIDDLARWNIADRIAPLIDNQPQLTFTGSYRKSGTFVGPNSYALTVSFESGHRNFNSVIRKHRWMERNEPGADAQTRPLRAFLAVVDDEKNDIRSEDKTVMSLTYKSTRAYSLTYDYNETVTDPNTLTEVVVPHTATLDFAEGHETCGKLQWGRTLRGNKPFEPLLMPGTAPRPAPEGGPGTLDGRAAPKPRFDLSVEYVNVNGDPQRQDRFVVRATMTLPLQGGLSLPLTIAYANHSQFLGEPDEQLTAHIGLSYKLNPAH